MRDVDERVAAVQGRVRRIKSKRERATVGALGTCTVLVLACVVGTPLVGGQFDAASGGATLFGTASLFGSSVGGYVTAAVLAASIAVAVTALVMMRRKSTARRIDDITQSVLDGSEEDGEQ